MSNPVRRPSCSISYSSIRVVRTSSSLTRNTLNPKPYTLNKLRYNSDGQDATGVFPCTENDDMREKPHSLCEKSTLGQYAVVPYSPCQGSRYLGSFPGAPLCVCLLIMFQGFGGLTLNPEPYFGGAGWHCEKQKTHGFRAFRSIGFRA